MITSKYGPPFNEDNWPKDKWVARKNFIRQYLESQTPISEYSYDNPIYDMLCDLWVALEAEEKDNEMYGLSLATIYDEASGGMISKPNTKVEEVIRILYERMDEKYNEGYEDGKDAGIAGEDI